MFQKSDFWCRAVALLLVLALMVPLVAACDDDDDGNETTPVASPTATKTAETTPTKPVSTEPIKIGILFSWSGAYGLYGMMSVDPVMPILEKMIEERGGVLGRPVKFIKVDDKSEITGTVAGFTKLVTQDEVSAVLMGGAVASNIIASSDAAEESHVPYLTFSVDIDISERPFTVAAAFAPEDQYTDQTVQWAFDQLQPKTVGFLSQQVETYHTKVDRWETLAEAAGIEVVLNDWIAPGTQDMSSYLTNVKYEDPDLLILTSSDPTHFTNSARQMEGLGGWGNTKVISPLMTVAGIPGLLDLPGAQGWYTWSVWLPGLSYPGAKEWERLWTEEKGDDPGWITTVSTYVLGLTVINAIEKAGSAEPEAIAKELRSGQFEFEGPYGTHRIDENGSLLSSGFIGQIKDGEMVITTELPPWWE